MSPTSDRLICSEVPDTAERGAASGRSFEPFVRGDTGHTERERGLERRRSPSATYDRIDRLLFEIAYELVGTPSREDVERTVCERLATSGFYRFAWIGRRAVDGDGVVLRASAGDERGDSTAITADERTLGRGLARRALHTGETQVANVDVPGSESRRTDAIGPGGRSAVAVPLVRGEKADGVLVVCADRPLGFGRREQDGLGMLGGIVGFTLDAIETRRSLFADAVVELEFRLADRTLCFVRDSGRFECELSVEGSIATRSGDWLLYVNVRGARPTLLCEGAGAAGDNERIRVIRDDPRDGLLEYRLDEPCLSGTLAGMGARLRAASAAHGVGRFVVEAPSSVDVRSLVGRVRGVCPGSDLVAKRERDRSVAGPTVPGGPLDGLTDRQHQAVETAYRAGYFEWPRENTAQEVAESMGISSPTLHRHLRKAQNELLTEFLDEGT